MEFRSHQFANGLELVAELNPNAYSLGVGCFVNTGSRDETLANNGVSHFLEHMMFKGTPNRTAWDINRDLDAIGARSNAMTSHERTIYYGAVAPDYQNELVDILTDIMRPTLALEDFEVEKQVILEEIEMYDDQPPYGASDRCMAGWFGSHPLGMSILGASQTVSDLTPEQMRAYFDERYSPANITIAAAGRVDWDQLVASVEQRCSDWTPFPATRNVAPVVGHPGKETMIKENSTQEYVIQLAAAPASEDERRFAARLLAIILGDDNGSRLYWEMIETGLAEYAEVSCDEYAGAGLFSVFLGCAPHQATSNLDLMANIFADASKHGVRSEEIEQAQNKISSQIVLSSERPLSRLFSIGVNWLMRKEYRTVREIITRYRSVTRENVMDVLQAFPLNQHMTVAIGPLDQVFAA